MAMMSCLQTFVDTIAPPKIHQMVCFRDIVVTMVEKSYTNGVTFLLAKLTC